jgi:hypothetical protein
VIGLSVKALLEVSWPYGLYLAYYMDVFVCFLLANVLNLANPYARKLMQLITSFWTVTD